MDLRTFNSFREIVYEMSGIALSECKVALVSSRIGKRMRALKITEHRDYLRLVVEDESGEELVHLLDAISTNVTHFFREEEHFDVLSEAFTKWLSSGQRRFRFWSCACSTGQEPYSMAMTLIESGCDIGIDSKILATDISTEVLEHSRRGSYGEDRLERVPPLLRQRYFDKFRSNGSSEYVVKDSVRRMIKFNRLNLSRMPFPMQGPLDVVFCRNVMIYFDQELRQKLISEIYRLLKRGGYLMVGHAESLTGMSSNFRILKPSVYIKD